MNRIDLLKLNLILFLPFRCRGALILASLLFTSGCVPELPSAKRDAPQDKQDPFANAAKDAEPGEGPFLLAAKPFLTAIAERDYVRVFHELSSHAKARTDPGQFVPPEDDAKPGEPIKDMTLEQCADWMKKMEARLGVPEGVQHVYVESIEPEVLAGKGDRLEVMFAIGAMPADIPADIRKASIRAQIRCQLSDKDVKKIASDLKISEEKVRAGDWPENEFGYDPQEGPYLNLKFVLVEEGGQLKVGYFEFMPPSILD